MQAVIALYDACVLYPAPLRDTLMHVAIAGLCRARWTRQIHGEWIESLLAKSPHLSRDRVVRTSKLMDDALPDALVHGYQRHMPHLHLPDGGDIHVLAAAIQSNSQVIVTNNTKDFPSLALTPYNLEAITADAFVMRLFAASPGGVAAALRTQRALLNRPPVDVDRFLTTLESVGLKESALTVRKSGYPI